MNRDPLRWLEDAACKGMDLALFFPARGASLRPALEACDRCPVRRECLDEAMRTEDWAHQIHGVRGGLSARARADLHRRVRRAS